MNKRLLIALLIIGTIILGFAIFFYGATATKQQKPVHVEAPVSKPTNRP